MPAPSFIVFKSKGSRESRVATLEKQKKLDAREMGLVKTPAIIELIRGLKNQPAVLLWEFDKNPAWNQSIFLKALAARPLQKGTVPELFCNYGNNTVIGQDKIQPLL